MKFLTVRQIDLKRKCEHIKLHKIRFPEMQDSGFYRTLISYSAFFESPKRRNKNDDFLYYLEDDYPIIDKSEYAIERDKKLPVVEHEGLYDFFEYIGYDRKTKRLTTSKNRV